MSFESSFFLFLYAVFIAENIPAHRDLIQFIEYYGNIQISNFLIGYNLVHVVMI